MISRSEMMERLLDQAGALADNGLGGVVEAGKIYRVLTLLVRCDNLFPNKASQSPDWCRQKRREVVGTDL